MDLRMNSGRVTHLSFSNALTTAVLLACSLALPVHAEQISVRISGGSAYAANQSIDDDLWYVIEQRSRFLQAESALKKRHMKRFRRLRDELVDYPLYPYLDFTELSRRLATASRLNWAGWTS